MHWVDWLIVCVPLVIVAIVGFKTQKYVKGVSDFLTAGRVAGRYVIAVASGEAAMGLVSLVAMLEAYYNSGKAYAYWGGIYTPISILLLLTGYCVYRFRETRAMTMGQFLEIRYSRSFRIFGGILQSISGIINYALFPAIGARFFVYFCGLPLEVTIGGLIFPTFGLVMAIFLSIAVFVSTMGGQLTIMVTDCIQGILSYPIYVIIVFFILYKFSYVNEMMPTLFDRDPGKSMVNPFDIERLRTFNLFYILVGIFGNILNRMAWSGSQGYNAAAFSAHEQKMGGVIGRWRSGFSNLMYMLLGVVAFTMLNIDSEYLHKLVGNKANLQKIKSVEKESLNCRKELAWKVLNDVAGEKEYSNIRLEVKNYLNGSEFSSQLASDIEKVKREEQQVVAKKIARKIELGLIEPDVKNKEIRPSRKRPEREKMVGLTKYALKTKGTEGAAKAQVFTTIFNQMRVPMALKYIFPVGITGIFCAMCIFLLVSTDTTYLHSWGSILVQDVILPIRGKPFTPRQQLRLLRILIASVAVFAFFFSFYFGQVDYVLMFFAITGALWLGGAGICIVGGLYWSRGTTAGAWSALISGSSLATLGIVMQKFWTSSIYPWIDSMEMVPTVAVWLQKASSPFEPYVMWRMDPDKFPINSQEIYLCTMILSISLYVTVSLLTCKKSFNMDRMLHRGKYHREGKVVAHKVKTVKDALRRIIGINDEYTKGDKALAWSVFIWSIGWGFSVWLMILIWNSISPWPYKYWVNWNVVNISIACTIGIVSTIWFTIGGVWDLRRLFRRLKEKQEDILDDGRVVDGISADDISLVEKVEHIKVEKAHQEEEVLEKELKKEIDNEDTKET